MSLTVTRSQIRDAVRQITNTGGTTALLRHPDANLDDYINKAFGSLHRKLTQAIPDQRFLATTSITTVAGTATYALAATFDHLASVDCNANGAKVWLTAYEMSERPVLTDPAASYSGVPFTYRLRGSNIELLPTPNAGYVVTLWYVPAPQQVATGSGNDSTTYDTINRLDDFLVAYAAKPVAMRDRKWDLVAQLNQVMADLDMEIMALARSRDKNSPSRIVDEQLTNRWGRRAGLPRRWR